MGIKYNVYFCESLGKIISKVTKLNAVPFSAPINSKIKMPLLLLFNNV